MSKETGLKKYDPKPLTTLAAKIREGHLDKVIAAGMKKVDAPETKLGEITGFGRFLSAFSRSQEILDKEIGIVKRSERSEEGVSFFGRTVTREVFEGLSPEQREELVLAGIRGDEDRAEKILKGEED